MLPRAASRELLDELVGMVHVNVRLTPEEQRLLRDDPDQIRKTIRTQVENAVAGQSVMRLVGADRAPPGRHRSTWKSTQLDSCGLGGDGRPGLPVHPARADQAA